eukprot:gnl/TRDRNA2_/TRDRNA2_188367_c0_seq1.p1 gnl/TRDRNA2_/TRDRNA2_188367_c0~~gnl/TRDRNA2_/TRDRNA2_188367_c0_seq1.p1  ORF type:complete len:297 (-),score=44.08 gnl/TRDRNA2_/TRDRNA2_188367_c0_seq1:98-988(-)
MRLCRPSLHANSRGQPMRSLCAGPLHARRRAPTEARRASGCLFVAVFVEGCLLASVASNSTVPVCNMGGQPPVAIGDDVMLCVFVLAPPLGSKKMVFKLKVEEHASLLLQGSERLALGEPGNLTAPAQPIHAWVAASQEAPALPLDCTSPSDMDARGGIVSCPQVYASRSHISQLTNLVVNMRDGVLQSFVWDNGCDACGPARCMDSWKSLDLSTGVGGPDVFEQGTCGQEHIQCAPADVACDLNIFVTWYGTDKDGRNARSAGTRLSRFTGPTLRSVYDSTADKYSKASSAVGMR